MTELRWRPIVAAAALVAAVAAGGLNGAASVQADAQAGAAKPTGCVAKGKRYRDSKGSRADGC